MMKLQHVGLLIIAITIAMGVILYSFSVQTIAESTQQCEAELGTLSCPHQGYIPPQTFLGVLFLLGLGSLGTYLAMQNNVGFTMKPNISLKSLDNEERTIYKALLGSNGTVFQSELMERTGFSKVKVTRVLDKLEAKNVVERRRRGMSNVVVLRHSF